MSKSSSVNPGTRRCLRTGSKTDLGDPCTGRTVQLLNRVFNCSTVVYIGFLHPTQLPNYSRSPKSAGRSHILPDMSLFKECWYAICSACFHLLRRKDPSE